MTDSNSLATLASAVETALVVGDLSKLSEPQRIEYYRSVCNSLGLNPLTKPFDYITLNGKLTLYARKDATDQIRHARGVSITKLERERVDGIYVVTAYAQDATGRQDSAIGAVSVENLKGDALANAFMKAETKAKRRVTLSICGLGMLDETELETIPAPALTQQAPALPKMTLEEAMSLKSKENVAFGDMTLAQLSSGLARVDAALEKNGLTPEAKLVTTRIKQALEIVIEHKRQEAKE